MFGMRWSLVRLAAWKMSPLAAVAEKLNGTLGGGSGHISARTSWAMQEPSLSVWGWLPRLELRGTINGWPSVVKTNEASSELMGWSGSNKRNRYFAVSPRKKLSIRSFNSPLRTSWMPDNPQLAQQRRFMSLRTISPTWRYHGSRVALYRW